MAKATEKNTPEIIYAFYTKNRMTNRELKRKIYFESKVLMEKIGEIEIQFVVDLFTEQFEYSTLYARLKKQYIQILKAHRFKHIIPNPDYLEQKYKPVT